MCVFVLMSFAAEAREWASWCDSDPDKGWHFYCDESQPLLEAPPPPVSSQTAPDTPLQRATDTATMRLGRLQHALKEARAQAILTPTEQNVEDYIRLQTTFLVMSGNFADTWRRVVWQNPDLDYEGQHPQSNLGKKAAIAERDQRWEATLEDVVKDYALLYVGSAACAVCKVYGPDLKHFSQKYGFATKAISIDGSALEAWPNSSTDQGQLASMGIKSRRIPMTLLYHRRLNQVTVLGVGYLAEQELKRRIHTLIKMEVGDAF